MSAFAALGLFSDNASSVSETLTPRGLSNNLATWRKTGSVYDADYVITASISTSSSSPVVRVRQKVVVPVMDTVNTSLKVAELICNVEFVLPKKSTKAQRTALRNLMRTLNSSTATTPIPVMVDDLEGVY